MDKAEQHKKTCEKRHVYYKSSDCPVCPVCAAQSKPSAGMLAIVSAPARRALEQAGIATAEQLSQFTEKELLALHGMGPNAMAKLKAVLEAKGLCFRQS